MFVQEMITSLSCVCSENRSPFSLKQKYVRAQNMTKKKEKKKREMDRERQREKEKPFASTRGRSETTRKAFVGVICRRVASGDGG